MHGVFLFLSLLSLHALLLGSTASAAPANVTAKPLKEILFYPERSAPAAVLTLNRSQVPAQIPAVLTQLAVNVGDQVTSGELLASLDCRRYQAELDSRQAQLKLVKLQHQFTQREWRRAKTLNASNNLGAADLDRKKTDYAKMQHEIETAAAAVSLASLQVDHCLILAPFKGVVVSRLANEGEYVNIGQPVVELVDLSVREVQAYIALSDIESLQQAKSMRFQWDHRRYPLTLDHLLPIIDTQRRSQEARFQFEKEAENPPIGAKGRLVWQHAQAHIPVQFLQQRQGPDSRSHFGLFIYEPSSQTATFHPLPEAEEGRPVPMEQTGVLIETRLVIDGGRFGLVDGQSVHLKIDSTKD